MSLSDPPDVHSHDASSADVGPAAGADPRSTAHDAITPELALVSPDLADTARRRLPNRQSDIKLAPPRESVRHEPPPSSGGVQLRHVVVGLTVVALVLGGLISGYEENKRGVVTRLPPAGAPSGEAQAKPPLLLPSAGYVVSPSGSFLTGASGRAIERFTLPLRCGPRELQITNVALSGRTFRYRGKAVGRATNIRLSGRLLDRQRVRGVVSARGPRCSAGPVAFVARVS